MNVVQGNYKHMDGPLEAKSPPLLPAELQDSLAFKKSSER